MYGPGDNYDLQTSHVLPALIRRFHEAKRSGARSVTLWGTGSPKRELLHSDDMADACVYLMELPAGKLDALFNERQPPLLNVGSAEERSIAELAQLVRRATGAEAAIEWDRSKPDGTPRKLLDSSRLAALGWHAKIPLEQGIQRTCDEYRRRG
jgi:GDP-L-fucose synthase